MELTIDDPRISVAGVAELAHVDGRLRPHRLPRTVDRLSVHPELLAVADMPAGGRLEFVTDAPRLELDVEVTMPEGVSGATAPFDVMVDGRLVRRHLPRSRGRLVAELGAGEKRVTIWLPQFGVATIGRLSLPDASRVEPVEPSGRLRWVAYGSSVTQCEQAAGPSETWPALVSADQGWSLTGLGFAGQCHLDAAVARHIRATSADLISLCLGINVWGASTFPRRTLGGAVEGFIATVRDGHPRTPLVVISPIVSPAREQTPNGDGLTLAEIRGIVHEAITLRQVRGDSELLLIDGSQIFGMQDSSLLVDGLHPGPDGYTVIAERLGPLLARALDRLPG